MTFPPDHLGEALSAYLDDELAPAARREADGHLAGCGLCREELELVAWARASIRALPVRACPPGLWEHLATEPGAPAQTRRALWAAAAVAAAVTAVLLPRETRVEPILPSLVESHATRASVTGDPLSQLAPIAVPIGLGR